MNMSRRGCRPAEACNAILDKTHWQIRLLSKSNLLHLLVKNGLIPKKHHPRMIFGFSTGTLNDGVAKAIETGTALVSKRLESLHWLQDHGFRTFGMICPSLPQTDHDKFSREICNAIRVDKCEHVWAEVINVRGKSLPRTLGALESHGFSAEALLLKEVSTDRNKWEAYARATFEAHTNHVPAERFRFLQYITESSATWWAGQPKSRTIFSGTPLDADTLRDCVQVLKEPIGASAREISRRIDHVKMEAELRHTSHSPERGNAGRQNGHITEDAIREAVQLLRSPVHRFLYELFWLWPNSYPEPGKDDAIAQFQEGTQGSMTSALDTWRFNNI